MDTLNDLKKLFENPEPKVDPVLEKEKRFIREAAAKLGNAKHVTSIQGYDPKEMEAFLEKPTKELQRILGNEWAEMVDSDFETFVYTMRKKVNKSNTLMNWDSK